MAREVLRAFKFTLAPTPAQADKLARYAGSARWAYNFALALKVESHRTWREQVQALMDEGVTEAQARKKVKVSLPRKQQIYKKWIAVRGDDRESVDGLTPWFHEVATWCFQSAFIDADRAWKNWLDSLTGKRAGRRVGYPRFKKKNRSRDSFRLHHTARAQNPELRLVGYRRLNLGKFGQIRLHDSGKRMARLIDRGQARVQSVTVSRGGHRWYASVLCKVTMADPAATRRQTTAGTVGVDLGTHHFAAFSQPVDGMLTLDNPRHLKHAAKRLAKAQQALARTQKGSQRRRKAARRVARIHHKVAQRRETTLHAITKTLATSFSTVAIEDLNVAGMTRSARGTVDAPGHNVRAKAGLNRSLLDAAMGEFRHQLEYKTSWYGSQIAVADRWYPSSKTCSRCGWRNPSLTLAERVFTCGQCGLRIDRDVNAARNIAAYAAAAPPDGAVAPGRGRRKTPVESR